MKTEKKVVLFSFLAFGLIVLGGCITSIVLKNYGLLFFIGIPALFSYPIYMTSSHIPERFDFHVFRIIMLIILRWVLFILAILIPALLWNYLGWVKETVNPLSMIIPLLEVLFPYLLILIMSIIDCLHKEEKDKEEKVNNDK